ncbi:ABC transporter ATP-binding protein [Simkania negevensis]|uniref:ABC transporter ATP-binding protein n=1 Tax=Simkania negevensis TaxID=83561 RepID=A0ABS3AQE0_9BACT|nr:ABC transporter ATP-binding protein [Simkania negevensis]
MAMGKTLAVVGESGCGKSMLALSIMGILPTPPALPPEGEVLYRGKNLLTLSKKEMRKVQGAKIAMIFQDPMAALNPVYTIGNQLFEAASLHLRGQEAYERVVSALKDVGMPSPEKRLHDYPHQLSGGMKQRVMIAMALLCEPDILIADEPTTALDVTIQAQVLDLIRDLQQRNGMAVMLITHDMGVVAEIADDVIVMYTTRVIEKAGVRGIFDRKLHPYTQGLFASIPRIDITKGDLKPIQGFVPSVSALPSGCHFHPRCPHVMDVCKIGPVPNIQKEEGHEVLCWLYEKSKEIES